MDGRRFTFLAMLLAFGGALLAGKFLFRTHPLLPAPIAKAKQEPGRVVAVPAVKPGEPARTAKAPRDGALVPPRLSSVPKDWELQNKPPVLNRGNNRELKAVADGMENHNKRMNSHFARAYGQGILNSIEQGHPASVRWVPGGQALRNELQQEVQPLGEPAGVRGRLDVYGGRQRYLYEETFPYVDERLQIRADGGVEHDYILKRKPEGLNAGAFLAFSGRLYLSPGLSLWDGAEKILGSHATSGKLQIKDASGNVVFVLRRPVAFDAGLTKAGGSRDFDKQQEQAGRLTSCQYQVERLDDGAIELAVATPTSWLNDPQRAYPVTIDPNTGPGGLSDAVFNGGVPIYTGAAGASQILPIHAAGGARLAMAVCGTKPDNGVAAVVLPFNFVYYGILRGPGTPFPILFVHIDGYADWLGGPGVCSPLESTNAPIPVAAPPNDAMFAYWDDLKFSADPQSGVYAQAIGQPGNRQLIIEWFRMGFVGGNGSDVISFNLILHECTNAIEFRILNSVNSTPGSGGTGGTGGTGSGGLPNGTTEVDRGLASVGIEDPTGAIGIQFDFDSSTAGPPNNNGGGGVPTPLPTITPGTQLTFTPTALASLVVTVDGQVVTAGQQIDPQQCLPVRSCFVATVTPPNINCGGAGPSIPPSFGFQWNFTLPDATLGTTNLITQAFTPTFCHTFTIPGVYTATLTVIDSLGVPTTFGPFTYLVCDVPRIILTADPQGGIAPLAVDFFTNSSIILPGSTILPAAFDDCNAVPTVGPLSTGLAAGAVVVNAGVNTVLETLTALGDDVLDTANKQILAGPNGIAETTAMNGAAVIVQGDPAGITTAPGGDDCYVGNNIVDGGNGIAETTAVPPDLQVAALNTFVAASGSPIWLVEELPTNNPGAGATFVATLPAGNRTPSFTFPRRGLFRVTTTWTGIDQVTNTPTAASANIFIFVEDPGVPVDDNLVITSSNIRVVWPGKTDGPDADTLPDHPNRDSMNIVGQFNLPDLDPSTLATAVLGVNVIVNATEQIFSVGDGFLRPNGTLAVRTPDGAIRRSFRFSLPSGRFSMRSSRLRLDGLLGLTDITENRLLPVHIRFELWDFQSGAPVRIYPDPAGPDPIGTIITYEYRSRLRHFATGRYRFGHFSSQGLFTNPLGQPLGRPGGQQVLVSSVFLVTRAVFRVRGTLVTCDVRGKLARFGGDALQPQANSDVSVQIGPARFSGAGTTLGPPTPLGFNETLNFSTSPTWRTSGRGPNRRVNFRRSRLLGRTGVRALSWFSRMGNFRIQTFPVLNFDPLGANPQNGVGLDVTSPATTDMVVPLNLLITNENNTGAGPQDFDGQTEFLVFRRGSVYSRR